MRKTLQTGGFFVDLGIVFHCTRTEGVETGVNAVIELREIGIVANNVYLGDVTSLEQQIPPEAYAAVSSSVQGAHAIAARVGAPMGTMIESVADKAFVNGMTEAMLIAAFIMAFASVFTFIVLPAHARCIEPECEDEQPEVADRDFHAPAPAMGD